MAIFSAGLSALLANQRAMETISQNIANANTPGYHRQVTRLANALPTLRQGFSIGMGVEVSEIRRIRHSLLDQAITRQAFELGDTTAQLRTLRQVEALLSPSDGALPERLEALFNQFEQLSARPDDIAQRRVLLGTAAAVTDQISGLAGEFDRLRAGLAEEIEGTVAEINALARRIAEINQTIQRTEARGISANDQRDRRDQLISELAELIDVRTIEQPLGQTTVLVGSVPVVIGNHFQQVEVKNDAAGNPMVVVAGCAEPLGTSGGKINGLLRLANQVLPDYQGRLDAFAAELMAGLDRLHATGLGLSGPLTFLAGHRAVSDVTAPLAQADLAFPPQAGSLFVTVTDLATGQRTLSEVAIDPASQSLQDVAAAISGIANLQAIAEPQTGTLRILAASGFGFDFAGRLPSAPTSAAITGTATAQIGGLYTGGDNDVFTFRVVGSGTVGVTPGLTLRVEDAAGSVLANLNIGEGYEPGSLLAAADGVTVSLSSGSVNNNDSFTVQVVAEPDSANILAALGLNTFFAGDDARTIQVQADLLAQPERLAGSRTGQPGDGANLRRMAALRDSPILAGGTQTLRGFAAAMVGDVGIQVQELTELQEHQELVGARLEADRQSISGVDPNEELVHLVQFQRSFEMAATYVRTVNEALDALVGIL